MRFLLVHKLLRLLGFFGSFFLLFFFFFPFNVALSFHCGYSSGRWINALSGGRVAECVWSALHC